jgi:hypothetical protein
VFRVEVDVDVGFRLLFGAPLQGGLETCADVEGITLLSVETA